jgi:L-fuconolactonase
MVPNTVDRIDSHQHYWSLQRGDYAWLTPEDPVLYRDFTPAQLSAELAECCIRATVLVQAAASEAETRFLFDLARQNASIAGVVGWVDFERQDVAERIAVLSRESSGKLKGLRPMIQDMEDPYWLDRPSLDAAFEALLAHDLTFDALVKPVQLEMLERRLQRHPSLRAVLDHAGKPDVSGGSIERWSRQVEQLARATSVHCKLSGLLTQTAAGAGAEALDAIVAHIFACFGAERVLWGSDWPVLTLRASYRQWLDVALELVRRHAPGEEQAVFGANAVRFYRLSLGG